MTYRTKEKQFYFFIEQKLHWLEMFAMTQKFTLTIRQTRSVWMRGGRKSSSGLSGFSVWGLSINSVQLDRACPVSIKNRKCLHQFGQCLHLKMLRTKHNRNIDTLYYVQKAKASLSKMWYMLQCNACEVTRRSFCFWHWKANSISVSLRLGISPLFFPFCNAYCRVACCFFGVISEQAYMVLSQHGPPCLVCQKKPSFLIFTKYLCWQPPRQTFSFFVCVCRLKEENQHLWDVHFSINYT